MRCIDHFCEMVQLVPLQKSDAYTMADRFLSMVVSQHRLLECIMSDHDPRFCVHFWDKLTSILGTTLTFSMASHPQTDRMAELTNCTIEKLL